MYMLGLTICADHSPFCGRAARKHRAINRYAKECVNGMAYTNGVKPVRAILKRGYKWVYHNWSEGHCCRHVNEFAFRFNEGRRKRDTQGRLDGLFRLMVGKPVTCREVTA